MGWGPSQLLKDIATFPMRASALLGKAGSAVHFAILETRKLAKYP